MVQQVRADARPVGDDGDVEGAQVRRRPDAGAEQDGRRAVRPGAEDDLPPAHLPPVGGAHAGRAALLGADAVDERVRDEGQVRALAGRREVGERRVHPHATRHVLRGRADARVLGGIAVEVGEARETERCGGGHEGPVDRAQVRLGHAGDRHRAVDAVEGAAQRVRLCPPKVRQQVGEPPAGVAQGRPAVVVGGGAPQPDAGVDRRAAADDPGAGQGEGAVGGSPGMEVAPGVRVGPDISRVPHVRRPGGRVGAVVGTRLQEGDRPPGVLGQPARQDAPGRSRAHDDDVEPPVARHGLPFRRARPPCAHPRPAFYPCPAADARGGPCITRDRRDRLADYPRVSTRSCGGITRSTQGPLHGVGGLGERFFGYR